MMMLRFVHVDLLHAVCAALSGLGVDGIRLFPGLLHGGQIAAAAAAAAAAASSQQPAAAAAAAAAAAQPAADKNNNKQ